MIMKNVICLILTSITINCACAQTTLPEYEWKVTLKVVDEAGQPVAGAKAGVGYYTNSVGTAIKGLTDTNGIFKVSRRAHSGILGFSAEKAGYYPTREPSYELGFTYDPVTWNSTHTLVLKKIGQPVPMYARNARIEIPDVNKSIGFDLVEFDWVAPYGRGKQADFIFKAERDWVNRNNFNSAIKLTFSNKSDGLVPVSVPLNQGGELRLSAIAPSDGYISELLKHLSHTPAGGWIDNERDGNKEQNYYFRIRTVLDEQGNVKSAQYGKIYGDFALDPINSKTIKVFFTYYLNPEPNSRNVEFDPKRNLSKNLSNMEGVSEP